MFFGTSRHIGGCPLIRLVDLVPGPATFSFHPVTKHTLCQLFLFTLKFFVNILCPFFNQVFESPFHYQVPCLIFINISLAVPQHKMSELMQYCGERKI